MPLRSEIEAKFTSAFKAKDAQATSALRMLRAALKNHEIERQVKELTDDQVIEIVGREVKKLKDALADFERGGRSDLAENARKEIGILSAFLPAQLPEEEVRNVVKAKAAALGLSGEAAYGRLMGEAMKELKGKADGAMVGKIVKEFLQS
jgi:hypothetical protein